MIRDSRQAERYPSSYYDDDMCLKPPVLLWLAVLYLARSAMLPLVIGVGHVAGVNADAMTLLRGFWSADQLGPALVALPILTAMCRRTIGASRVERWIWARGRICLALSAAFDIALRLGPYLWSREFIDQFSIAVVTALIDGYALFYIVMARRVRDTFLDFPPPLPRR